MSNIIRDVAALRSYLQHRAIDPSVVALPTNIDPHFPLRLPEHYANLINWHDPADPLKLMVIPTEAEMVPQAYELKDPIGDHDREVVPGLIHRYPDRCLLLLTTHCLIHCRFCFRREVVGKVRPVAFKAITKYLAEHQQIREVIFSGGDPGTFPAGFFYSVGAALKELPHLQRWRVHTRVPVADPLAINAEWLAAFTSLPGKKILVMHVNHPRELSPATVALLKQLLEKDVLLLSQTVLLKGVNTGRETLAELFTQLITVGVKPYYLHHLDQALGTDHFRISIEAGKELYRSLRGHVSSICLPEYVLDLPGGLGKTPVFWLQSSAPGIYTVTTFEGKKSEYRDPAVFTSNP